MPGDEFSSAFNKLAALMVLLLIAYGVSTFFSNRPTPQPEGRLETSPVVPLTEEGLLIARDGGKIIFSDRHLDEGAVDFDNAVVLSSDYASVDSANFPQLAGGGVLEFFSPGYSEVYYAPGFRASNAEDFVSCPESVCTMVDVSSGKVAVRVSSFSTFTTRPPEKFRETVVGDSHLLALTRPEFLAFVYAEGSQPSSTLVGVNEEDFSPDFYGEVTTFSLQSDDELSRNGIQVELAPTRNGFVVTSDPLKLGLSELEIPLKLAFSKQVGGGNDVEAILHLYPDYSPKHFDAGTCGDVAGIIRQLASEYLMGEAEGVKLTPPQVPDAGESEEVREEFVDYAASVIFEGSNADSQKITPARFRTIAAVSLVNPCSPAELSGELGEFFENAPIINVNDGGMVVGDFFADVKSEPGSFFTVDFRRMSN